MTKRVEIPAYTDRWMMGDRYGELIKVTTVRIAGPHKGKEIAHVQLDKSGKVCRFVLADCREI